MDLAGSKTRLHGKIKAGPGLDFPGASAFFNGDNHLKAKHRKAFNSKKLTYSFWIYLIANNVDKKSNRLFCPLILKGFDQFSGKKFHRYPGIYIDENTRKLRAYVSLSTDSRFPDVSENQSSRFYSC